MIMNSPRILHYVSCIKLDQSPGSDGMHLTVLVLHELKRHELAPALKIIWGKSLSSGAPSECDWKIGAICSSKFKDFKLT